MSRALVLQGARELRLEERAPGEPGPRAVRIRALMSAISHGTELSLYRGTSAFAGRVFDRSLRAFVEGAPGQSSYPATLGYEMVGRIEAAGDAVHEVAPGDLVHVGMPHAEEVLVDLDAAARSTYPLSKLPDGAGIERWLFVSLGAVALVAVHDGHLRLGDHVVVVGAGAIGLLLTQMVRLAGARRVTVIEPLSARRELALALGADFAFEPGEEVGAEVKRNGRGADVVIETSGVDAGLQAAISAAAFGARVVTAGFYQGGAPNLRLGEEWHHNRLDMVSSMGAWGATHRAHPAWDRPRIMQTVVALIEQGRVLTETLPLRRFPFERVVEAYRWLDAHPNDAVKVVLTYEGRQS